MARRSVTRRRRGRIATGLLAAAGLAAVWGYVSLRVPASRSAEVRPVEIEPGMSARAVARMLSEKRLIRSGAWFLAAVRCRHDSRRFQPGLYHLRPNMTALEMLGYLVDGRVAAAEITIPEGYSLRQIAGRLESYRLGLADGFLRAADDSAEFSVDFPLPQGASLEGYLFPDTYFVPLRRGAEGALIRRMLARFDEVVWRGALGGRPPRGGLDLEGVVTLASLVEAEAKRDGERPIIAGVLMNRLRQGMRLQCDATVQYALGNHRTRLLHSDLLVESPYNTYLHAGLPPGPINNPGLASIQAALHPAQVPYLYYVARADGSHVFSVSFEEHRRAIERVRAP